MIYLITLWDGPGILEMRWEENLHQLGAGIVGERRQSNDLKTA
jgi:hypothetical protein